MEITGGINEVEAAGNVQSLDSISANSTQTEIRALNIENLAQNALDQAFTHIGKTSAVEDERNAVSGASGAHNKEVSEFVSGVERPGVEVQSVQDPDQIVNKFNDRMIGLYKDLTIHHVAWNVAQRMQKDMSQLLRGS